MDNPKRQRKPKKYSRMDNPETLTTLPHEKKDEDKQCTNPQHNTQKK